MESQGRATLRYTRQMIDAFRELCGAVTCRELKSTVNGRPLCPCEDCVRNAVLVYGSVMGEE